MFINTMQTITLASWEMLINSSIFILFGFIIAGILKGFLPRNFVNRHLGKGKYLSVVKASALGVPLPLCSCGVLPAAAGLREDGANKGATAAFLVSTPETGIDSIAVSWALLDPIMTIFRPIAAFFTAIVTGVTINLVRSDKKNSQEPVVEQCPHCAPKIEEETCCSSDHCHPEGKGIVGKLKAGMSFAFGELFDDIGKWFLVGIILAGLIDVFLSPEVITNYLGSGIGSMILVLLVSVPLYICATASTPIAAALALKGLSPGAALVLLLAGPATNAATMTVVAKLLGKKATVIYIVIIALVSLIFGIIANHIYIASGLSTSSWIVAETTEEKGLPYLISAIALLLLIVKTILQDVLKKFKFK